MLSEAEYFEADALDRRSAAQDAVQLSDQLEGFERRADRIYAWLRRRESLYPTHLTVGNPMVAPQDDPSAGVPATRTGAGMPVTMADNQIATYPPATVVDSKGFQVPGDQVSISEDSGGAVVSVSMADGSDPNVPAGSAVAVAVAPGTVNLTWTDAEGQTFSDSIDVTAGPAAGVTVGPPVITNQA